MSTYFPQPYPDELFYSLLMRYADHTLLTKNEYFSNPLLRNSLLHPSHPTDLLTAFTHICTISNLSAEQVIINNTLFPYYSHLCQTIEEKEKIFKKHLNKYPMKLSASAYLRYCPSCSKNDRLKFGETYWHRAHQLPLSSYCFEHNEQLLMSDQNIYSSERKILKRSAESLIIKGRFNPAPVYLPKGIEAAVTASLKSESKINTQLLFQLSSMRHFLSSDGQITEHFIKSFSDYAKDMKFDSVFLPFLLSGFDFNLKDYYNPFSLPAAILLKAFLEDEKVGEISMQ